jgi:hypothetical protein
MPVSQCTESYRLTTGAPQFRPSEIRRWPCAGSVHRVRKINTYTCNIHTCVRESSPLQSYIHVYIHTYTYINAYIYIQEWANLPSGAVALFWLYLAYIWIHKYMNTYIHTYIHTCLHVHKVQHLPQKCMTCTQYIYMYMYMYVCMYIYIYIYTYHDSIVLC